MVQRALVALSLLLAPFAALSQQPSWFLLGRHECADLQVLVKMENLQQAPESPEQFIELMRQRGERVVAGPLEDAPPELLGKVVQVDYGKGRTLLFAREEICRGLR